MDAFELRDRLVAAMPADWAGLELFTVYDEDHRIDSVRVRPDLSRVESHAEAERLDKAAAGNACKPVLTVWCAAPAMARVELARLLGANGRLSDEDGVMITKTVLDVALVPDRPVVE